MTVRILLVMTNPKDLNEMVETQTMKEEPTQITSEAPRNGNDKAKEVIKKLADQKVKVKKSRAPKTQDKKKKATPQKPAISKGTHSYDTITTSINCNIRDTMYAFLKLGVSEAVHFAQRWNPQKNCVELYPCPTQDDALIKLGTINKKAASTAPS